MPRSIAIVEDEPTIRANYADALRRLGFEVQTYASRPDAQSAFAGIQYVESVQQRLGAAKAAEFLRLYTAPGVDHVGTGAPALTDPLGALSNWVEKGAAPSGLTLTEQDHKTPAFTVARTRPLCEWPAWPKYKGSGDANAAASFECVK